jgi:hypothetical protein
MIRNLGFEVTTLGIESILFPNESTALYFRQKNTSFWGKEAELERLYSIESIRAFYTSLSFTNWLNITL